LWHPILDELVAFVDFIQNKNIKRVSYYNVTSGFINDILDGYGESNFTTLRVTGASLGGGLAIITGAQTGAAAVAISGLGAELIRHTLDPPVTMAQINEHVFNFIPDRDYIARSKKLIVDNGGLCLCLSIPKPSLISFCLILPFSLLHACFQLEDVPGSIRRPNARRLQAVFLVVIQCGVLFVKLPTVAAPMAAQSHAGVCNVLAILNL